MVDLGLTSGHDLEIRLDSKLVVEQMSGRWKIKHEDMRRLALQARDLTRQVTGAGGTVRYTWVPRAENTVADALSNEAMDGRVISRDHLPSEGEGPGPGEHLGHGGPDPTATEDRAGDGDTPEGLPFGVSRAQLAQAVLSTETDPTLEGAARVILVRHGVTDFTVSGRLDGRGGADPALNETGRLQARAPGLAVARLLERSDAGPVQVVTSDLARAMETGALIGAALGLEPGRDSDWDEQSFGDWDGMSMGELLDSHGPEMLRLRRDADYAAPGGETHAQLAARVDAALRRSVALGGTVVVATHRKPIMCVLASVLGIDHDRIWSLATGPASLSALEFWGDGATQVAFVNDTHHLH